MYVFPVQIYVCERIGKIMRKGLDAVMKGVFFISALMSVVAVALICIFLFMNGVPAMAEIGLFDFLGGTNWSPSNVPPSYGIFPMIVGSLYVTAGALAIGIPIGVFTAIFMANYCPKSLYKFLKPAIQLLAGIPSVVYGFFGVIVVVPFIRNTFGGTGSSILTASIILGIMVLPTIIEVTESSLRAVPSSYYEGAIGLGASHERAVFFTVLPAAKSGVTAGIVLGIGRVVGETMAVQMVAGNQTILPDSILDGVRTLTAHIVTEMGYSSGLHREALIATAVVLFVFILLINLCCSAIKNKSKA